VAVSTARAHLAPSNFHDPLTDILLHGGSGTRKTCDRVHLFTPGAGKNRLVQVMQEHLLTFEQQWTDEASGRTLPSRPIPRHLRPRGQGSRKVVPTPPAPPAPEGASAETADADKASEDEPREIDITKIQRGSRLPWAVLLKRVFMTDALTCPKCQGRVKILAAITEPEAIRKILDHLGIASEAPRRTGARPPPQAELSGTADLDEVDYADPPSPEW
jgi:hypothetical protein